MRQGVPEWNAWITALSGKGLWRISRNPSIHQSMNLKWMKDLGLVSVKTRWEGMQKADP